MEERIALLIEGRRGGVAEGSFPVPGTHTLREHGENLVYRRFRVGIRKQIWSIQKFKPANRRALGYSVDGSEEISSYHGRSSVIHTLLSRIE